MKNNSFELPVFDSFNAREKSFRSQIGDLLEASKLSRLPSLPKLSAFAALTCGNCSKRLDASDDFQIKIKVCRVCLVTYAAVGDLIANYTAAKIRRHYSEGK